MLVVLGKNQGRSETHRIADDESWQCLVYFIFIRNDTCNWRIFGILRFRHKISVCLTQFTAAGSHIGSWAAVLVFNGKQQKMEA